MTTFVSFYKLISADKYLLLNDSISSDNSTGHTILHEFQIILGGSRVRSIEDA